MQLLASNTTTGSLVTPLQIISYTHDAPWAFLVQLRVIIGVPSFLIVGGGVYTITVTVNGNLVVPVSSFTIPSGITSSISLSREIILNTDDVLVVSVQGQAGDTSAGATVAIYDVTPATIGETSGTGQVLVNHDYPAANDMTLLDGAGTPIVGACIYIYTEDDFSNNRLTPEYIVARSLTVEGGFWKQPVALNAGSYVAYFFKQGVMSPTSIPFSVEP